MSVPSDLSAFAILAPIHINNAWQKTVALWEDVVMGRQWRMVHGNTHSQNAQEAERRGEMPLTRAIEIVYVSLDCKKHKISRRQVREFLQKHCERGWHHVAGPNGVREVDYYATSLTDGEKRQLLANAKK